MGHVEAAGQGERDVKILVGEARGQLKKKEAELTQALVGKLNPTHRLVLQQSLDQVSYCGGRSKRSTRR